MATPLTAAKTREAMKKAGIKKIVEVPKWEKADRPGAFNPHGMTIHITAGGLGGRSPLRYIDDIINGDKGVPLKSNGVTDPDGVLYLNAIGNTNHCLYYSQRGLDATLRGSWPLDKSTAYRGRLTKWSPMAYGLENIAAAGKQTFRQYDTSVRWAAAYAWAHGWTGQETHGHGEIAYDRGFADPGWNMGKMRRDVMDLVKDMNGGKTPPAGAGGSKPADDPKPWDEMNVSVSKINWALSGFGRYSHSMKRLQEAAATFPKIVASAGMVADGTRGTWNFEKGKSRMQDVIDQIRDYAYVERAPKGKAWPEKDRRGSIGPTSLRWILNAADFDNPVVD